MFIFYVFNDREQPEIIILPGMKLCTAISYNLLFKSSKQFYCHCLPFDKKKNAFNYF